MIVGTSQEVEDLRRTSPDIDFGVMFPSKIAARKDLSLSTSLVMPSAKVAYSTQANKFLEFLTRTEQFTQLFERNRSIKFVPSQTESLTNIPSESLFGAFADTAPIAEKINTPNYDKMKEVYNTFLRDFYIENFDRRGRTPSYNTLIIQAKALESQLKDILRVEIPTN
jgi:maltose-binding protein MalE